MDRLSLIEDYRKLEEKLGKVSSDLLMKIMDKREESVFEKFATREDFLELKLALKADIAHLEKRVEEKIGNMAWKMAGLLTLQAGVIVALIKLL